MRKRIEGLVFETDVATDSPHSMRGYWTRILYYCTLPMTLCKHIFLYGVQFYRLPAPRVPIAHFTWQVSHHQYIYFFLRNIEFLFEFIKVTS